jgi:hypothetical protein
MLAPCLLHLLLCDVCSYPASVGRNMDEIVRVVDALLLSAEKSVATPANWPNNHADQVGSYCQTLFSYCQSLFSYCQILSSYCHSWFFLFSIFFKQPILPVLITTL